MGAVDLATLRQSITRSGAQEEYLTDSEVWAWNPTLSSLEALQLEIVESDIQVREGGGWDGGGGLCVEGMRV